MLERDNRMQVELLGESFTVKGGATPEEIKKTSAFLNERLQNLKERSPMLSPKSLAILTAFSLAEELLSLSKDYEVLAAILDSK